MYDFLHIVSDQALVRLNLDHLGDFNVFLEFFKGKHERLLVKVVLFQTRLHDFAKLRLFIKCKIGIRMI